ncbi:MAG: response regulator [Dehalococcoidia bacterium]|nr:response regulator [Dehalococcoidia bacterium]
MRINLEVTLIAMVAGLVIFAFLTLRWVWRRFRRREHRAIAGLQAARNRMHSLFSQVGFMACAVDRDGIITWVEGSDIAGLGLSTEHSTGRHYSDIFQRETELQREIRMALKGEPALRRVTDHSPPYQLSIRPVFGDDGHAIEVVAVIADIADEVRETDRAERLARFRSEFLSAMNFHLRTPLSDIVGVTGLLANSELAEAERDSVVVIKESSDTLLRFIDDLIDYGELDAGRLQLVEHPFNLRALLNSISAEYQEAAAEKGISFVARYPHQIAQHFNGDAERIRQIISNLVANAVEFTQQGHVLLDVHESGRQVNETTIRISVEDTGPGIPPADIKYLFEGFGASAMSSSPRGEGTGLGLGISRRLAQLMGGDLTVESRPGSGSAFTFQVDLERTLAVQDSLTPVTRASAVSIPATTESAGVVQPAAGRTVLLAEDSLVQQKVVARMLSSLGFEVSVASDGREAVEALEAASYDIVFMDCQMPKMDGFEATARVRALDGARSAIPIVAMTADAMPGDRERCLNAGMSDYLSKPVNLEKLRGAAERWILLEGDHPALLPSPSDSGTEGSTTIAGEVIDAVAAIGTAALRELEQLGALEGDSPTEPVTDLIDAVLSTAPSQLIGTRDGVTGNDLGTVEYWLTPYRTSCRLIGALRSEQLAGELLDLVRSGDFFAAETTLKTIEQDFPTIKNELRMVRDHGQSAA